ncbi:MAG: MBOAT family protein [Lachnospiraceae bacterium]|nr:MBOAT family protein [Lachnospiraceae bacterium]
MSFNSIEFIIFFIVVCAVYFVMPKKWRYIWLLGASYFFYMNWSIAYTSLLLLSTAVTYLSGIIIQHYSEQKNKKAMNWTVAASFIINLAILVFFKYGPFMINNANVVYGLFHHGEHFDYLWRFALPVGISFYTFQALSYTMDVYRGEVEVEHNFFRYALFVSFFPQLVAGPIERSSNLLVQLKDKTETTKFEYERVVNGLIVMLWGFFLKMVIADRAAICVDFVWNDITRYGFVELAASAIIFAFQVYTDFAGYSAIAIGASQVLGFTLMENFQAPFLSDSVKEFWQRFHISLNTWFRDYLFYPVLRSEGIKKLRKNLKKSGHKYWSNMLPTIIATAIVWVVSGFWHGADWAFVLWGVITGGFLILEETIGKKLGDFNRAHKVPIDCVVAKIFRKIFVVVFYAFTMIFFRAANIGRANLYLNTMFHDFGAPEGGRHFLTYMGMDSKEYWILFIAIGLMLIADAFLYFKNMRFDALMAKTPLLIRWGILIFLFTAVWVMGIYGPEFNAEAFIYFQF